MNQASKINKKTKICWDEDNLSKNEVIQKEIIENMRKKGQKIDEAKTPYSLSPRGSSESENDDDDDDDEYNEEELKKEVAEELSFFGNSQSPIKKTQFEIDEDEEEENITLEERLERDERFKKKRREHYNEFKVMQEWKKKGMLKD